MTEHRLCDNCLGDGAVGVPVGHSTGHQRDPVQGYVTLCQECKSALLGGHFNLLHSLYRETRTITRHLPNE